MEERLFGCFDDPADCAFSFFCTPCHAAYLVEKTGGFPVPVCLITHFCPFPILLNIFTKTVLEKALRHVGVTTHIPVVHVVCCLPCVRCQAAREIKNRQAKTAVEGGVPPATVAVVDAPAPVAATK